MAQDWRRLGYIAGIVIPLWLLVGVILAASFYPGYSHRHQALSELGATGAPTDVLSPLINNFPLGGLFLLFAYAVFKTFPHFRLAKFSAVLIGVHGVASIGAGLFSCDMGCNPPSPSVDQQLHNLFGAVMFLSLLIASALWGSLSWRVLQCRWLAVLSAACCALAILTLWPMAAAIESGENFGVYQRLNYGVSVLWLSALAGQLYWLQGRR